MLMQRFTAIALAGMLALGAVAVSATTMVESTTLDLAQAHFSATGLTHVQDVPAFTALMPFTLTAGDVLDYTIHFKGTQSLTLTNPSLIWGYIYADTSTNVNGTGSIELLDASGSPFLTSNAKTDDEGAAHFGQLFGPSDFGGGLPVTLTFYGIHYVGTLNSYADPTITTRNYAVPALAFSADSNSIAGAVPEPGVWALFVAGFGLVGMTVRRRALIA
jgi:hypothetical protein